MGCCPGGGGWAWGMSDGVSGRSVTASQRGQPLSGRRDMCWACPTRRPALGFMASLRPVEGLRPGLQWEGLMSAWLPLLDFCPAQ